MFAARGFARFARTHSPRWRVATGECMNWFKPLEGIEPPEDQNAQRDEASLDAARRNARIFRRDARTPRRETFPFASHARAHVEYRARARVRQPRTGVVNCFRAVNCALERALRGVDARAFIDADA